MANNRNRVVHDGSRGLYSAVPKELARDGSLSASARSVALYVWSHDQKWQQSRNDIAEALGISVNTAGKALRELEEHRWMVRNPIERTWFLRISNTPFTEDEARNLSGQLDQKLIQSVGTGSKTDLVTGSVSDPPTGSETDPHRSTSRSAPEVHDCRSTRTDQDETGSKGRSLAVEGSEATEKVADGRGLVGPSQKAASDEAAEYVPDGLQPATSAGSRYEDPFAVEPSWLVESRGREKRNWRSHPVTGAGSPYADPWADQRD
ncbi:helix-turn-helix domain-containing protein [Mycolicibacterium vaccae]|uniref:helix-turn-helix domain-containing protein n=1 Tax=Mycolicibacterium vaccae TaxID=1810 RepID=UPI003D01594F